MEPQVVNLTPQGELQSCYKKTIMHFTKNEWMALGLTYKMNCETLKPLSKFGVIHEVLKKKPEIVQSKDSFYYFEKWKFPEGPEKIYNRDEEPTDPSLYNHIKTNFQWVVPIEKLTELVATEPETKPEIPDLNSLVDSNNDNPSIETVRSDHSDNDSDDEEKSYTASEKQFGRILHLVTKQAHKDAFQKTPSQKLLSQKIKFEPKAEIQRFLSQVETYATANHIKFDHQLVSVAIAAMNVTDEGSLATESLSEADKSTWSAFKKKLIKLLGHSPEYYRNYFSTFKRGNMRLGLAFSCLSQAFRRGWQLKELDEVQKKMVITAFINSLENPLKYMLKSEQGKLTFDTVTERAIELEGCIGADSSINALTLNPDVLAHVNSVQPEHTKIDELLKAMKEQHLEMLKMFKSSNISNNGYNKQYNNFQKNNSNNYQSPNSNNRPQNRIDDSIKSAMGNLCLRYATGRKCHDKCRFKHSGEISENARKAANKYYKNFNKTN